MDFPQSVGAPAVTCHCLYIVFVFFPSLFSGTFFCRRSYSITSRSTQHPPSRDTRHNVAATRQPNAPFSSPYRPSFVHLQPFRITGTIKRPFHSSIKHSIHLHMHPYTFFPLISRQIVRWNRFPDDLSREFLFPLVFPLPHSLLLIGRIFQLETPILSTRFPSKHITHSRLQCTDSATRGSLPRDAQ